MEIVMVKPKYYSVRDIKILEHCGKDKAYEIAQSLPHERRGKRILVFAEDYEKYYEEKRKKVTNQNDETSVYKIRKIY